eukprot:Phypoly_transcript_11234.p1 GENE.Phypoly_transcript_11234~~Phypoly_transcript_11234.p1  ORF type:complete len:383 (+),score=50.36 Phypoly_transcript_11234:68-1216(+)
MWFTFAKAAAKLDDHQTAQYILEQLKEKIGPDTEILEYIENTKKDALKMTYAHNSSQQGQQSRPSFAMPNFVDYTPEEEESYLKTLAVGNPYIEITKHPQFGRAVFAKRDIPAHTRIIEEEPIISVTADEKACQNCYVPASHLRQKVVCDSCKEVYCSEKCRADALQKFHSPLCGAKIKEFQTWVKGGQSSSAKTSLTWVKHYGTTKNSEEWKSAISEGGKGVDPFSFPQLRFLHSSMPATSRFFVEDVVPKMEYFYDKMKVDPLDPYFDGKWMLHLQIVIMLNAFNIPGTGDTFEFNKIKGSILALYETLSLFNHSCAPNAFLQTVLNPKTPIITTKPIKKGEQVFISYINPDLPRETRQDLLHGVYGFACDCVKCTAEKP